MADWCLNVMKVTGAPEEIKAFAFASVGLPPHYSDTTEWREASEKYFSFNALVPVPEQVLERGYLNPKENDEDGYWWCVNHWGTARDVYWDELSLEEMGWHEGCDNIELEFETAYAPPGNWLEKAIAMYPGLTFKLSYGESNAKIAGVMQGHNGVMSVDDFEGERLAQFFEEE